jgi:ferric-dicitrate binding protein FerR (iron transport regulator)
MSEIDRELLERYLSGVATPDECERVEAWLTEDPERWAQVTALRDEIAEASLSEPAVEQAKAEVWARLVPVVGEAGEPAAASLKRGRRGTPDFAFPERRRKSISGALAAAVVVLTIGGGVAATLLLRRQMAPAEAIRVAATAPAERATFRLPDGTQVMLGVASTLRYPAAFTDGRRAVALEGEAYFDVIHEEQRPFIVLAGDLVAMDLGTQFTVRAYPDDPDARVVVREGKVAIRAAGDGVSERVVAPGQLGRLTEGNVPTVEHVDTAAYFAWTEGRLVFDDTPLREALPQLGRWFDLEFRLADSTLGDVPLSATLKSRPTPDVLDNLAASLELRQRQEGRIVTLYSAHPGR